MSAAIDFAILCHDLPESSVPLFRLPFRGDDYWTEWDHIRSAAISEHRKFLGDVFAKWIESEDHQEPRISPDYFVPPFCYPAGSLIFSREGQRERYLCTEKVDSLLLGILDRIPELSSGACAEVVFWDGYHKIRLIPNDERVVVDLSKAGPRPGPLVPFTRVKYEFALTELTEQTIRRCECLIEFLKVLPRSVRGILGDDNLQHWYGPAAVAQATLVKRQCFPSARPKE